MLAFLLAMLVLDGVKQGPKEWLGNKGFALSLCYGTDKCLEFRDEKLGGTTNFTFSANRHIREVAWGSYSKYVQPPLVGLLVLACSISGYSQTPVAWQHNSFSQAHLGLTSCSQMPVAWQHWKIFYPYGNSSWLDL